ncbi:MAG: hypothetical protein HQL70_03790 [Magnetococcales bacterium]|nr:hypothetical protein [Magnetococcales bacterium]
MPLLINGEHVSQPGYATPGHAPKKSFGRIVSGMKVTNVEADSVGMSKFMQNMSLMFKQDRVNKFGAEDAVL